MEISPPHSSAPIPYAVDPHTVERAWFLASRWSAPLYERPGRQGPRLLGSAWVDGVRDGSPHARHHGHAVGDGAPSIPVPADPPPGGIFLCPRMLSCPFPHARSAPPGGVAAGEDRAAAPPTRRRAPAPCAGLDEVEKVLSRCDELLAVVAPHVGAVAVQSVQETDRVDLGHALADLVGCEPGDGCRLA